MRILDHVIRTYTNLDKFDAVVAFYEGVQTRACDLRFDIPDTSIKGARIGAVLVLAGEDEELAPAHAVQAILYVDSLDDFTAWIEANGAQILHGAHAITFGRNMTVRHPDVWSWNILKPRRSRNEAGAY